MRAVTVGAGVPRLGAALNYAAELRDAGQDPMPILFAWAEAVIASHGRDHPVSRRVVCSDVITVRFGEPASAALRDRFYPTPPTPQGDP